MINAVKKAYNLNSLELFVLILFHVGVSALLTFMVAQVLFSLFSVSLIEKLKTLPLFMWSGAERRLM